MSETSWNNFGRSNTGQGVDSMYQLIVVAALRNKQLVRGAAPRINVGPLMHRSTTIALEETRRGLVAFTMNVAQEKNVAGDEAPPVPAGTAAAAAGASRHKDTP
jgi:DNA-directed RNA polymerase omega subunit